MNRTLLVPFGACVHYWDVSVSNHGVCRKCGAKKQFQTVNLPTVLMESRRIPRRVGRSSSRFEFD